MSASPLPLMFFEDYHHACEAAVSDQNQLLLCASYIYLSMGVFFSRFDVALKHFSRYFLRRSHQWTELIEMLMSMQTVDDWHGGLRAIECTFQLEKNLNQSLMELHDLAMKKKDINLCDFLQCHYLCLQVQVLKKMGDHLTNIHKMDTLGEDVAGYIFDRVALDEGDKND
ncbi:Ferritin heavy chain [Heterocephalus glaber]|uniref:Ferritin n=1 Tax=Heterocephalus glaber TaxID=10181 RepID=G5BC86_HETGA|nr:Ferritin heavy chain [Heterocephalus glaber]